MAGAEQHRAVLRESARPPSSPPASRSAGVISAFGAMWRRSMQMPGTMQFSSGYSSIGMPLLPKWRGASMWVPPWSGMEKNITLLPCTLPDSAKRLLVGLPDAVDDRRLARIARRAVIELAAQIDDAHGAILPNFDCSATSCLDQAWRLASPKRLADLARAFAASMSRSRGGASVTSESSSSCAA